MAFSAAVLSTRFATASNTAVPKFRVRIHCKLPRQTRNLEDLCEHRFGSLQDAFEAIDVEGVGIITREDPSLSYWVIN